MLRCITPRAQHTARFCPPPTSSLDTPSQVLPQRAHLAPDPLTYSFHTLPAGWAILSGSDVGLKAPQGRVHGVAAVSNHMGRQYTRVGWHSLLQAQAMPLQIYQ